MGRNRNNRRHRNELSREIQSHLALEAVQNDVEKEAFKKAHEEHIQQLQVQKDDTLAKTVLITAVKDVRKDKKLLVKFMTHHYVQLRRSISREREGSTERVLRFGIRRTLRRYSMVLWILTKERSAYR